MITILEYYTYNWFFDKVLPGLITTFISISITIFIFTYNNARDREKRKRDLSKLNKQLKHSTEITIIQIDAQIEELHNALARIRDKSETDLFVVSISNLNPEPILKIPVTEIFQSFLQLNTSNDVNNYNIFITGYYSISDLQVQLKRSNEEFQLKLNDALEKWISSRKELDRFFRNTLIPHQKANKNRALGRLINRIQPYVFYNPGRHGQITVVDFLNAALLPMVEEIEKSQVRDRIIDELLFYVNEVYRFYDHTDKLRISYGRIYFNLKETFELVNEALCDVTFEVRRKGINWALYYYLSDRYRSNHMKMILELIRFRVVR